MMKSPWFEYESLLAAWMKLFSNDNLQFTNGYTAIPGFPTNGFRADGLLTDGKVVIALEIEVKQTHPDTNVGKYWLLDKYKSYNKVILFHVYTPPYNSYPWRMELAQFYADKMSQELPFEYHLIDQRTAESVDLAFQELTQILRMAIHNEFTN
ncbi:hypothetical protein LZT09_13830 [Vibrio fluvialis]|uniref:hypothetical protein n=1 Tax=Vibrio TaxID=662 RepID=UPI000647EB6F|nr:MULTISPECIES: hypothetical protein [Vibrio]HDM8033878.1 hypothetical protein [Vibrio fluvialis clinical-1]EKO3430218.1 hypothetical protein [Vibrio fluvialis]EKO3444213.1 hypothetical protein [Vibrio fluvialis]EKO3451587.1 hypothetical protein [Vibrio fluvialis]EKO3461320.1 hypothetical protein [Vibrio fluvialis]